MALSTYTRVPLLLGCGMAVAPAAERQTCGVTRAHDKDKASRWKLSGARSTIALADDAQVVSGPGSVPLGRMAGDTALMVTR